MGNKLAIKGHSTRGKEVIEVLEMMGGKNKYNLTGTKEIWYILSNTTINHSIYLFDEKGFTLEEFLEKYPFKVGDVIRFPNGMIEKIAEMKWDEDSEDILCTSASGCTRLLRAHLENPKNNKQVEEEIITINTTNELQLNQSNISLEKEMEWNLPQGYQFVDENGNVINATKIVLEKKKKEYPKTYEECCKILGIDHSVYLTSDEAGYWNDYELGLNYLIEHFRKLLICRDAYWKIAGEEIGLDDHWEPDWDNLSTNHEFIKINKGCFTYSSRVLVFPNEEMRDAFYENFKSEIESCKELL